MNVTQPAWARNFSLMSLSQHNLFPDFSLTDSNWQALAQHPMLPAAAVCEWLLDEGSLTQQLIALSDHQFEVKLVWEGWVLLPAMALSRHFGPLAAAHRFWSRKVMLFGKGQPWVSAHTLIPEHSFSSPLQQVMRLKTKPLGEFLFSYPELIRSEMDFTLAADQVWGRRSLFFLFQKPVMVAEFFLPELLAAITASPLRTAQKI